MILLDLTGFVALLALLVLAVQSSSQAHVALYAVALVVVAASWRARRGA